MRETQLLKRFGRWDVVALLALAALLALYVNNLTGWMIFDDEGEYLYQVWRMTLGEVPYRDFLTPQLPAFLYTGLAVMSVAGKSLLAMRLATVAIAFATAIILYVAGRKHAGPLAGLISMVLYLLHPDVFRETRIWRNEPLFLLFVTAGLVVATWTPGKGRRRNVAIAGVLFGLATMAKLFGLLPAAGVSLWLFWEWWRRGRRPKELLLDALALAGPLFGTIGLFGLIFSSVSPEFLDLVLGHHLAQGSQLAFLEVLRAKAGLLWWYLGLYPVLLALAIASAWLGIRAGDARVRWAWQLVTVVAFAALSRELGQRHFMYLLPSFLLLAGWLLGAALHGSYRWPGRLVALAAIPLMVVPWMQINLDRAAWVDTDTARVLTIIEERTEPGSAILADDIGLAFYSDRPTTYSGAALSHGAVTSGQITGDLLMDEIVQDDVRMVIVDESLLTGNHMVFLRDYPRFHRFLEANFDRDGPVRRDYQELAIWTRQADQAWNVDDVLAIQYESGALFGETMVLGGYTLPETQVAPGDTLTLTLFWENEGPADNYWSVFVHLLSEDGQLIAQHDKVPYDGLYPPNQWWPGQVVDDDYALLIPPATSPGVYTLSIGMYDHLTGERLALRTPDGLPAPDNQITLPQPIRVVVE
jgi:hypothetical protein